MKVSLNWIKEFLDFDLPAVDEIVQKIGAQLGAVEEVVDLGNKYQGVVVVKVVECAKLEGSHHLNVCRIDDGGITPDVKRGDDGLVQVVCGAPNVRAGVFVAWLTPGSTVPSSYGSAPFVLETRELRGVMSNGMLASPKELAVGDSHEGLLILDGDNLRPGASFSESYGLGDTIIDIENKMFTHRPDCFGQLGVAREVAAIAGRQFKSPAWYLKPETPDRGNSDVIKQVSVTNEIPELCPRYMVAAVEGVKIESSPVWLQTYLSRVGIRPINNIVDLTNYIMLLTGQPLHAFDFDKVAKNGNAQLVVRQPHADEEITLLDGKTIKPRQQAILIATPDKAIALGGVMGGNNSEIDAGTTRILIECANFDMYNIRRTSMEHGIFTDAVARFNKGQSSWQCPAVLYKALDMTLQLCREARLVGEVVDDHQPQQENQLIKVSDVFVNERLGLSLTPAEMAQLLKNAEFEVTVSDDLLSVKAPFWRTDIELREDIVEEVGRLYGYDKLPRELPRRDIMPAAKDAMLELKAKVRASLSSAGANEVLTYSFVHGKLLDNVTQSRDQAFKLSNALSPDLQYYRLHALPSLLDKVHLNIKAGYGEFALFELNKGHNLMHANDAEGGVPTEIEFLDFVYAAKSVKAGAPFYQARQYLDALAKDFGLSLEYKIVDSDPQVPVADPYDYERSAYVSVSGGDFLGMVGEFKPSVTRQLKLPPYSAGFTIGPWQLLASTQKIASPYAELPRYPKIDQDITLQVPTKLAYGELAEFALNFLTHSKPPHTGLTLCPLDIYQADSEAEQKRLTFRVNLASFQKTLRQAELGDLLDQLTAAAHDKFGAERI